MGNTTDTTTKVHVSLDTYYLLKDYAVKLQKEMPGVKVTLTMAIATLAAAGYKSKVGKDYKPKGRG